MGESGGVDEETPSLQRKGSISTSFVASTKPEHLEKLLATLRQLHDLGHTNIESSQKFADSITAKLGDPKSPTSPSRHPLCSRIPTEDLRDTSECIQFLIDAGISRVPCLKSAIEEIQDAADTKARHQGTARDLPWKPQQPSEGSSEEPPELNVMPASPLVGRGDIGQMRIPEAPCEAPTALRPMAKATEVLEPVDIAVDSGEPAIDYEWHDDEEMAFENTYRVGDCTLCFEMITEDEFTPHWANGLEPPPDQKGGERKGSDEKPRVIETTKVHKGQDDLGQKMINQYTVMNELGKGSYGKVKLAVHSSTQKKFAIKIINKSLLKGKMGGQTAMDDVLGEVAIMKRCNHKNVCRLHEVIDDQNGGKMYLIVDYYQKGPVYVISTDNAPLSTTRVKKYLIDVCQGLDYLHQMNILHRDIKPANILVGSDDTATLTDFGISHSVSAGNTEVADTKGTPAFLTPEQIRQEKIGGKMADIWALGVTFYAMAFGKLPFNGVNYMELCKSVLENEPEWSCDNNDLQGVLRGILKKDVDERIGKNKGVRDILTHPFLLGDPGAALQTHVEINVTEEDKQKAVLQGTNIQLRFGNTVGVMLQVKGAMKGFLGCRSPPADKKLHGAGANPFALTAKAKPQPVVDADTLNIEYADDDDDDEDDDPPPQSIPSPHPNGKQPSFIVRSGGMMQAPLTPKRSFRTEEEAVMEDTTDADIIKQIDQFRTEGKEELTLNCLKFEHLPDQVLMCDHMTSFTSHLNGLKSLPDTIHRLSNLVNLSIAHNDITALPEAIARLENLQRLDCNHNKLSSLPPGFERLERLRVINLDYNVFSEIPPCLCDIKRLEQCFIIQNEAITDIPLAISNWDNCQLALTNTPCMVAKYESLVQDKSFPRSVAIIWNKMYPDMVEPLLYLGSLRTAQHEHILKELNVSRIVTAGKGLVILNPLPDGMEQVTMNVDDNPDQKMTPFFNDIAEYIHNQMRENNSVLVHCFAGLSRSVACVCAYLIKMQKMTFKEAMTKIKKARPAANPNNGFRKQLIDYEFEIHGTRLDPTDVENYSNGPSVEPEDN